MGNLIAASMFDGHFEAVDRHDSYSGNCPSTCSSGYISQYCACPASNQGLVIDRNLLLALVLGAAAAVFAIYQAFLAKAAAAGRDFPQLPGFFDAFRIGKFVKKWGTRNCFLLLPPLYLTNITLYLTNITDLWFHQNRVVKLLVINVTEPWISSTHQLQNITHCPILKYNK